MDEDLIKGIKSWTVYSKVYSKPDDIYVDKTTPDAFFDTDLLALTKKT